MVIILSYARSTDKDSVVELLLDIPSPVLSNREVQSLSSSKNQETLSRTLASKVLI